MESKMHITVVIFLIIVLVITIYNMIRLGSDTTRNGAQASTSCDNYVADYVNLAENGTHDNEASGPDQQHLQYKSRTTEPILTVV
jgi:hypothetical protein